MINNMLAENVVQESTSPWASPIVLAKKDGCLRFCVDYRRLNAVTRKMFSHFHALMICSTR